MLRWSVYSPLPLLAGNFFAEISIYINKIHLNDLNQHSIAARRASKLKIKSKQKMVTCLHPPAPPSPKSLVDLKAKISAGDPPSTVGQWLLTAPQRKLCIGRGGERRWWMLVWSRYHLESQKPRCALRELLRLCKKKKKLKFHTDLAHTMTNEHLLCRHKRSTQECTQYSIWVFIHANPYIKESSPPPPTPRNHRHHLLVRSSVLCQMFQLLRLF